MGKHCGYLALIGAIASGADLVYLNESGIHVPDLERDLNRLKSRFSDALKAKKEEKAEKKELAQTQTQPPPATQENLPIPGEISVGTNNNARSNAFFIVRNEASSDVFTIDFLSNYFESSSEGLFEVRKSLLGNYQQGGTATGKLK